MKLCYFFQGTQKNTAKVQSFLSLAAYQAIPYIPSWWGLSMSLSLRVANFLQLSGMYSCTYFAVLIELTNQRRWRKNILNTIYLHGNLLVGCSSAIPLWHLHSLLLRLIPLKTLYGPNHPLIDILRTFRAGFYCPFISFINVNFKLVLLV